MKSRKKKNYRHTLMTIKLAVWTLNARELGEWLGVSCVRVNRSIARETDYRKIMLSRGITVYRYIQHIEPEANC